MDDKSIEIEMIALITKEGKAVGNKTLIADLRKKAKDLTDDDYWRIRNKLIEEGKISKARGKGGAVYLLDIEQSDNKKDDNKKNRIKERDLYSPFLKVINNYWVKENDIEEYISECTAEGGGKKTGGKWTRPDITLISIKNYQYVYGKIMEVITFEIKPEDNYGIASVFETASQSVFAHKAFLCIHFSAGKPETDEFDRIQRQCDVFGVGLIVFENADDWGTYETIVEPRRKDPDPYEINLFIKQQLSDKSKEELSRKIKS